MKSCRLHHIGVSVALAAAFLAALDNARAATFRDELAEALRASDRNQQIRAIFNVLARTANADFPDAIARLQELQPESVVLGHTIGYWFERDLPAARSWMDANGGERKGYEEPIFIAWSRVDPAGMIDWLNRSERTAEFTHVGRRALFDNLAKEDPAAAAELSLRFPKPGANKVNSEREFFAEWARRDPSAAAARVLTLPTNDVKMSTLTGVVSGWCDVDIAAARAWVAALDDPALQRVAGNVLARREEAAAKRVDQPRENALPTAAATVSQTITAAVSAALKHVSDMHILSDCLDLLEQVGPEPVSLALETLQQQGRPRVFTVLRHAYANWARKDLKQFRSHVEQVTEETRAIAQFMLIKQWAERDAAAAREWATRLPTSERDYLLRSLDERVARSGSANPRETIERALRVPGKAGEATSAFAALAGQDPGAASRYALSIPEKLDKIEVISAVIRGWTAKDPAAALAWVVSLDQALRPSAVHRLFDNWARKDLEAAISAARALPDKALQPRALATIADIVLWRDVPRGVELLKDVPLELSANSYGNWGRRDPRPAAEVLTNRLTTAYEGTRSRSAVMLAELNLSIIVAKWIETDSAAATAFVLQQPDRIRRSLYRSIVDPWAKSAPGAPAQWLLAQFEPDAAEWKTALAAAVAAWAERSEKEVAAWLDGMPADDKRDSVTAAYAQLVINDRPDEALMRIRTITGLKQQGDALQTAWIRWLFAHREAALKWLETAAVSSEERELLIPGRKRREP